MRPAIRSTAGAMRCCTSPSIPKLPRPPSRPSHPIRRNSAVDAITLQFSEPIVGLDLADLSLTRNGGDNLLTGAGTLGTTDNRTWTLGGLAGLTGVDGAYALTLIAANSGITDAAGNPLAGPASDTWLMDSRLQLIQGQPGDDRVRLVLSAIDPTKVDVYLVDSDPTPSYSVTLADVSQWYVLGAEGNDKLTVDFSHGSPLPPGGLLYDGGGQVAGNTLAIVGTAGNDTVTVTPSQVLVAGMPPITYLNNQLFRFSLGSGADSLIVSGADRGLAARTPSPTAPGSTSTAVRWISRAGPKPWALGLSGGSVIEGTLIAASYTVHSGTIMRQPGRAGRADQEH